MLDFFEKIDYITSSFADKDRKCPRLFKKGAVLKVHKRCLLANPAKEKRLFYG